MKFERFGHDPKFDTDSKTDEPLRPGQATARSERHAPDAQYPLVIHPGLLPAIVRERLFREYRAWVVIKGLMDSGNLPQVKTGQGIVAKTTLVNSLEVAAGRYLGKRRNLYTLLALGEGTFWETDARGRVWVFSPDRVAQRLGLKSAGRLYACFPLEDAGRRVADFRDLIDAVLKPQEAKRLSRAANHQRTGRGPTTQRRREHAGKARYHDGEGLPPVARAPEFIDYTRLVPGHVAPEEAARQLEDEGLFCCRDARSGRARLLRQSQKPYQRTVALRRRRPKLRGSDSRVTSHPGPGSQLVVFDGQKQPKAVLWIVSADSKYGALEAIPGVPGLDLDGYFARRDGWVAERRRKCGVAGLPTAGEVVLESDAAPDVPTGAKEYRPTALSHNRRCRAQVSAPSPSTSTPNCSPSVAEKARKPSAPSPNRGPSQRNWHLRHFFRCSSVLHLALSLSRIGYLQNAGISNLQVRHSAPPPFGGHKLGREGVATPGRR